MKVTNVEKKEKSTVELTIQVEVDVFETAVQKVYLKNRSRITVPGFRKGKAPRKIIEKMYGAEIFHEEAINECYPAALQEAIEANDIEEIGYPRLEVVSIDENGLTFKALVTTKPEVKISNYKGLQAPKEVEAVTEEDIENELKPFVQRATRSVSIDGAVKDGDTAVIDFEGFDQGVPFDGGKGDDYALTIGSGSFVPGFEEQLIGMKKDDEKDIDIKFPEEYAPDLAGKDVVFHVKIKEVKEPQAPEVDDEFAKDVSEFDTLAEFKESLGKKLEERRKEHSEQDYENAILDQLVDHMEGEVPDVMVAMQIDKLMEDYARRLTAQGMSMEQYTKMMGGNMNALRQSLAPTALQQVKSQLALGAVADVEKFVITDEELMAEVKQLAEDYNISEEQVKQAVPEPTMRSDLRLKRAAELVIAEAKIGPAPEKKEESADKEEKKEVKKEKKAKKETEGEEKPKKRTTKAKEDGEVEKKPRAPRKKKTEEE
ncbi:MAG: trigger factor [Eubacteriales bacterium]